MNGVLFWQRLVFTLPSVIIGALLCLVFLFILIRKPSWLLGFFFCFYLLSLLNLAGTFISLWLRQSAGPGWFSIGQFWEVSLAICRLRYLFLVLFVHSAYRFRITPWLTGLFAAIVGLGISAPFFIYSIIPNLMEITVVLYAFCYWLTVYFMRDRLALSSHRLGLLRAVLLCSGFFLLGIVLDLLEDIPQASAYISILLIDFYPIYLVSIGGVMVFWAVRDLLRPLMSRVPVKSRRIDFSKLPVTKREREIINLILRGETNASIADVLFISESTVKKHINNLFRKLAISSRWELLKLTEELHPKE